METLVAPAVNFLILVGVLAYTMREPLRGFVSTRHDTLRADLQKASQEISLAKRQFGEFSAKLNDLGSEVSAMRAQVAQDADAMRARIAADAEKLAITIRSDARLSADGLYREFRSQLRAELGERILARAEEILRERLTGDDKLRIRREFSSQMERAQ